MSTEMIAVIVVGSLTGWLAGFAFKDVGSGMAGDLALGLGGGIMAAIVVQAMGIGVEAGWFAMGFIALVGAVAVIGAQRLWNRTGRQRAA